MNSKHSIKFCLSVIAVLMLCACTPQQGVKNSVNLIGMLFGAMPEPKQTTVLEELTAEYDRCMAASGDADCAQQSYAAIRKAKGMDEQALPKGIVIVREDKSAKTVTIKEEPPALEKSELEKSE